MGKSSLNSLDLSESYWRDIQHFQPLSRQREIELVHRARAGDEQAMHQMVEANLRFVVRIARGYHGARAFLYGAYFRGQPRADGSRPTLRRNSRL